MNKRVFLLILVVSAVIGYLFYGAHQIQLLSLRQHSQVFTDDETGRQTVWYGGPRAVATYAKLGNQYAQSGEYELAVACYKKAIGLDPNFAYSHFNLGNIYFRKGDPDAACESYKRAIELKPDFCEAHENLGHTYEELRQYDCAYDCYYKAWSNASSNDENNARFDYNTAGLADRRGDISEAIRLYKLSILTCSTNPTAKNNLAYLYTEHYQADMKKLTEADKLVDEALAARPNSPEFLDTKGWVLYRMATDGLKRLGDIVQSETSCADLSMLVGKPLGEAQSLIEQSAKLLPTDKTIAMHERELRLALADYKQMETYIKGIEEIRNATKSVGNVLKLLNSPPK